MFDSNVVFLTKFPFTLLSERYHLDLTERCFVFCLCRVNDIDETPIAQQRRDCIASTQVRLFEGRLLPVQQEEFLEVDDEVSTLLVQDMARLK